MQDPVQRPGETLKHLPVILRRWRPGEVEAAYTMVIESRDHLRPWMPWAQAYTRGDAADYLAACEQDWQTGTAFGYAITAGGRIVGCCGLMARIAPGGLEIGYWVHAAHIRRGLATAATAALTDAAFRLPGVDHVEIVHDELNEASAAVPRKLGFTKVGSRSLDVRPEAGTGIGIVWRLTRP